MTELLDSASLARNTHEFTVSELAASLKRAIEDGFGHVRVRGEVSGWRGPHSSGHCYFCLKDERARLDAVIWRGAAERLRRHLVEGVEVIATGKLTTFAGKSTYQIVVEALEPAGIGALMAMLEERKKRLAQEGLFDADRKHPLPFLPDAIGVVTSPTGSVIRDILHRLSDRFPTRVLVWPARVQGEGSAAEIAGAIRGFNAIEAGGSIPRPDLIIVARGGGSLEDLWSFNEEIVVRAAAESAIPLISAIGHETDWTLIDMASDHRAPTPSAAAERAVPVRRDLIDAVEENASRLSGAFGRLLDQKRVELRAAVRGLGDAEDLIAFQRQAFDDLAARLPRALLAASRHHRGRFEAAAARLTPVLALEKTRRSVRDLDSLQGRLARAVQVSARERTARVASLGKLLDSLGYRNVLARGFALVRDAQDKPIREAADVRPGAIVEVEMKDGRFKAVVAGAKPAEKERKPKQIGLFGEAE